MSSLLEFYRGKLATPEGFRYAEILAWSDTRLEDVHTYIQWLFPLPERSGANPSAPVLDIATVAEFRRADDLRENLRRAWLRMLRFYGLRQVDGGVARAAEFSSRAHEWLHPGNHNHLRLTRILRSLRVLGLEHESETMLAALLAIAQDTPGAVTPRTVEFWKRTAAL